MSVIVHRDEPIEEAVRRLQGETLRENIFEVVNDKRYHKPKSLANIEQRRAWKKRKKRSRSAKRKARNS